MSPHEVRSIGMRVQDRVRAQFSWPLESDRESAMMLLQNVNSLSSNVPDWTEEERENSITSLQERLLNGPIAAVGAAVNSDEILSALNSNHRFIFADGSIAIKSLILE